MRCPNLSLKKMIETIPRHPLLVEAVEVSDLADQVVRRVEAGATGKPLGIKHFHQPGLTPGFFVHQAMSIPRIQRAVPALVRELASKKAES